MIAMAWVVLALILLAVELHHIAFYALFGAIGAGAAAVVAWVRPNAIGAQCIAALGAAAIGLVLVRPYVSRAFPHHHDGRVGIGVHGGFIGERVVVLDAVSGSAGGHVRLAGESWLAVSGTDTVIPAGSPAIITGVRGTTLTILATDDHMHAPVPSSQL